MGRERHLISAGWGKKAESSAVTDLGEEGPPCFCREGWIKILPTGSTEPECPLIIVVVEWGYMSELCPQERKVALLLRGEIMEFRFLQQA